MLHYIYIYNCYNLKFYCVSFMLGYLTQNEFNFFFFHRQHKQSGTATYLKVVYLFIYSSGSIPTSEMYVIYQCYEHLATLTVPPAPYCTRATSLNLWVSGKSGPEYGIGPGCKARLIMKQLEKYIFFRFLFMEEKIKGS